MENLGVRANASLKDHNYDAEQCQFPEQASLVYACAAGNGVALSSLWPGTIVQQLVDDV